VDSDPHHFSDAGPNPADLDWYQFQANDEVDNLNFFSIKFQYAVQYTENFDTFEQKRKIITKHCELAMLWLKDFKKL
jgi:hypothetical protein